MSRKRQLGVALPDELRERIEAVANESGRSIADEIRRRLERTLAEDAADQKARDLADDVRRIAGMVFDQHQLHWHEDAKSYEAMREAVLTWLDAQRPTNVSTEPSSWGDDDPKTVGRVVARDLGARKRKEKTFQKLKDENLRKLKETQLELERRGITIEPIDDEE